MPNSPDHAPLRAPVEESWLWREKAAGETLAADLFAVAPIALMRFDRDLNPVLANDAYRLLLAARGIDDVPDYRAWLSEVERLRHDRLLASMAAGQLASFRIESTLVLPLNRSRSVLISGASLPRNAGEPAGFVIALTDVTTLRRHVENEARRHDAVNQAMEEMLAGLVLFDAEDRLVFCNRRYREFYGVPEELARPGTRFADMLLEEVRSGKLAMSAEEQESFVNARLERRSSKDRGAEHTVVEQRNADGRWLQIRERVMAGGWVVGVHVDATALKDKELALEAHIEELRTMRAELEQRTTELSQLAANLAIARDDALGAARTKANFLANMSHELRTPLNAVIGFAEILASGAGGPLTPQQTEYLTDIRSSGNHLLSVINDILDISKAEAGKIELQEEEIELADFAHSTVRLMLATARNKNIEVLTSIPESLTRLAVRVDVRRFRQVVLNLLSNAIKFTPDDGRVQVSVAVPDAGGVALTISDTGVGIDAKDLTKVFAPFEQGDSSLSRKYEGTGLGLALVKALIELHHGKVTLSSTPGVGTEVMLWLPPTRVRHQD